MDSRIAKFIIASLFISLTGCTEHEFIPYQAGKNTPWRSPQSKKYEGNKALFLYSRKSLNMQEKVYAKQNYKNYQTSFLKFYSIGVNGQKNNEVTALYSRSKLPGPKKLLVILPIWGGSSYPSNSTEQGILKSSRGQVNVLKILGEMPLLNIEKLEDAKTPKEFFRLLKVLVTRTQFTIIDTEQLINWVVNQSDISRQNVFVIGFSKGVFVAGMLAQIDPEVTGAVLVMGGADPSDILYHCSYYQVRHKITTRFHWSSEKLKSILKTYFAPFNVANYPTRLDPTRVLIFDSKYDECIPKKARDDLWLSMGKPDRMTFFYDHKTSFYAMTPLGGFHMRYIIDNFINQKKFSVSH